MIQAYERRVLTYVPTNDTGFQVEMGNIGQHYFDWRYRNYGYCANQPVSTPTAPVPAPTGTAGTPVATTTAVTTGTPMGTGTPETTGTPMGTTTPAASETATETATPMTPVPMVSVTP